MEVSEWMDGVGGWVACFLLTFTIAIHVDLREHRVGGAFGLCKGLNLGVAAGLLSACLGYGK